MQAPKQDNDRSSLLVLYGREGCHLCEDMESDLERLSLEQGFRFVYRDVDAKPEWREAYSELVPILFFQDQEVCRYFLDPVRLAEMLRGSGRSGD